MLIGELAVRTATSPRLLRHYEAAGLLTPHRRANGYREYTEADVPRVRRIRTLLTAGLPARVVASLLPCTTDTETGPALAACPGVPEALRRRLTELDERAERLETERTELRRLLAELT
ncbi:MerR family transcriptional regulator [Streptomyces sp. 5-8]|uniref:MerR family transcriptional regulator n=1 Tax=Streptomyces musisoli TaxID=2802280 RepID=A0ABS1P1C8_9ACTN|nr:MULTISPECIES: MerR family transcriptional regulator [Streptomyces]MBL1105835.1 MerR family transcriptional regulator [Streptomyces musisoli]MBY8841723.1 MerR family transcriptional regulator [Streptomyces sp. SP2-10]